MADLTELMGQFDQPTGFSLRPGDIWNRAQRQKNLDKAAYAIYDAMEPQPDPMTGEVAGRNPLGDADAFKALSRQDRIAKVAGVIHASVLKQAMADAQQRGAMGDVAMAKTLQDMQTDKARTGLMQQQTADNAQRQGGNVALMRAMGMTAPSGTLTATREPGQWPVQPSVRPGLSIEQAMAQNPESVMADPQSLDALARLQGAMGKDKLGFGPEDVIDLGALTGKPELKGRFVTRQTAGTFTQPFSTGELQASNAGQIEDAKVRARLKAQSDMAAGWTDRNRRPADSLLPEGDGWVWRYNGKNWDQYHTPSGNFLTAMLQASGGAGEPPKGGTPTSPAAKKRVRVKGPQGQRGTIEQGDTLPDGWSLE